MRRDDTMAPGSATPIRISRRQFFKGAAWLTMAASASLLAACGGSSDNSTSTAAASGSSASSGNSGSTGAATGSPSASGTPSTGATGATSDVLNAKLTDATLNIAIAGEPPTIDYMFSTATLTQIIAWHMWETLLAPDKDWTPKPMLADSWESSTDGLTWTFHLRQGVKFHNGDTMTAKDVVSSLNRWGKLSHNGKTLFTYLKSLTSTDDNTIVFQLTKLYASLLPALAAVSEGGVVMPASIADAAGANELKKDYVGTGPYKFDEWLPDVHVKLTRFDDYKPRQEAPSGMAGARVPIVKDVVFVPQSDVAAGLTGLLSGQFDFVDTMSLDQYTTLKSNDSVTPYVVNNGNYSILFCNDKQAPCDNVKFRQAVAAALDCNAIMSPIGPKEFWKLNPSYMPVGRWYSDAGKEYYNQADPTKAKQLLKEAGYNGEKLVFLSTNQYENIGKPAQVVQQEMKDIGLNIDFQVTDWATVISRRAKQSGWHFFVTGWQIVVDPTLYPFLSCAGGYPGFYCNEQTDQLLADFEEQKDFKSQYASWEKIQEQYWSQCHAPLLGLTMNLKASKKNVTGWNQFIEITAWNISKG